jgi:HlyD family secretion protein
MKKWLFIAASLVIIAAGAYYFLIKGEEAATEPVKTAKVSKGDLRLQAVANGTVNPEIEVIVKSKAGGEIIEFSNNAGDLIKNGDVVVKLNPETEEARAKQAEAELLGAKARLERSKIALKDLKVKFARQKKLFEDGIISAQEHDDSDIAFQKAGTDVSIAEAELMHSSEALKEARERLADTSIRAPFTGTILKKFVDRGQVISSTISSASEGTQIFSMANLDKIFVTAGVDEVDIAKVSPGQAVVVTVDALPERLFEAVVERVAPQGRTERTVTVFDVVVRVVDKEKALLMPGMTADVKILTEVRKGVLLVPREAVKSKGSKAGVFVVKAGGQQEFVEVKTGASDGVSVEINNGVSEGDEVVTSGTSKANNSGAQPRRRMFF